MADTNSKKPRKKSTFSEILNLRFAKLTKIVSGVKRQFVRASLGGEEFPAIESALAALATKASALPVDFKAARTPVTVQPMDPGAEIEIATKRRDGLYDLLPKEVVDGKWKVVKSTAERVQAQSLVDTSINNFFARRDVHLAGIERAPRKQKLDANGNPVPRKPRAKKGEGSKKVAPVAAL